MNTINNKILLFIQKQWFLIGMIFMVILAALFPSIGKTNGPLKPEITIKYILIPVIFILSGISLKTGELGAVYKLFRLHTTIQLYNLLFIPISGYGISMFFQSVTNINESLLNGIIIACCVPCTISMCNIFTQAVDGNLAVSLINSSMSNLLSVIVTPSLLLLFLGKETKLNLLSVLLKICLIILVPFIIGQTLQHITNIGNKLNVLRPKFKLVNTCILLIMIFSVFSDTFSNDNETNISFTDFIAIFFIVVIMYIIFYTGSFIILSKFNVTRATYMAGAFCSAHKSIAMGIPLINVIYQNNDKIGLFSLPLLIYHPTQLVLGSLALSKIKQYIHNDPKNIQKHQDTEENKLNLQLQQEEEKKKKEEV